MRRDLVESGIGLIILGIILYIMGSYLSSPSYFMESFSFSNPMGAYDTYNLGNNLEIIGLIVVIVGIVLIPIGYFTHHNKLTNQGFQQSMQPYIHPKTNSVKYCPNCGTQLAFQDCFCKECGYKL